MLHKPLFHDREREGGDGSSVGAEHGLVPVVAEHPIHSRLCRKASIDRHDWIYLAVHVQDRSISIDRLCRRVYSKVGVPGHYGNEAP